MLFANVLVTYDAMSNEYLTGGADEVFWVRIAANAFWFATVIVALVAKSRTVVAVALVANLAFITYWLLR